MAARINLYVIDKRGKKEIYEPLIEHYIKTSRKWADVRLHMLYPKTVARAHEISAEAARKSYTATYENYLKNGYSVALDPQGIMVDSHGFAKLFKDRAVVNLFVGGAFGLERDFVVKCNTAVSLGKITLSHKLITVVVLEQIFRGLSIVHHHPYHK
jgi:23S rRNA (pseudouridine1915-N3)-methyltransferase